jgi:tRNA1Val (adenine37-N6)-methyltransferase
MIEKRPALAVKKNRHEIKNLVVLTGMEKERGPFAFKQFVIHHDRCAMKVGTDAVLLGAWTNVAGVKTILDIGTGSGILALMLAQRTPPTTRIDAVEIAQPDFVQATENTRNSPWPEKIKLHHTPIQTYRTETKYDLIVCNPPYFINSLLPSNPSRKQARHTGSLSSRDLLAAAKGHLSKAGTFSIILPTAEGIQFQSMAEEFGLYNSRRLAFFSRKQKPQERWLMEYSFQDRAHVTETLILYEHGDEWSEEYKILIRDFYVFP